MVYLCSRNHNQSTHQKKVTNPRHKKAPTLAPKLAHHSLPKSPRDLSLSAHPFNLQNGSSRHWHSPHTHTHIYTLKIPAYVPLRALLLPNKKVHHYQEIHSEIIVSSCAVVVVHSGRLYARTGALLTQMSVTSKRVARARRVSLLFFGRACARAPL